MLERTMPTPAEHFQNAINANQVADNQRAFDSLATGLRLMALQLDTIETTLGDAEKASDTLEEKIEAVRLKVAVVVEKLEQE